MRKIFTNVLCLTLLSLFFVANGYSRDKNKDDTFLKPTGDPNLSQDLVHKTGKVWNTNSNFGRFGDPNAESTGRPSMEWPGGSGTSYLWEGRFWVGGTVNGVVHVSHADFGNYEFYPPEGSEFEMGAGQSIEDHWCTYDDMNASFHTTEPLGVTVNEHGLTWSTPDFDDFIAYEFEVVNTGANFIQNFYTSWIYDSDIGVVADPTDPHIDDMVDYEGWDGAATDTDIIDMVENIDMDGNGELDGYDEWGIPYGLQYLGNPETPQPNYNPSNVSPDGFYDEWALIEDEDGPVVHFQTDGPYGNAGDVATRADGSVIHGYLIPRNMSYMYDADNNSTAADDTGERNASYGPVDGFLGGVLIYTDRAPFNTTEADTFLRPYSHQWWNWESDPGTDLEKYQYFTANHPSSVHKFQPRPLELGAPTFDYRWMTTTGPFEIFAPGDTLHFVYAAVVGQGLKGMRVNAENAIKAYYSGSKSSNPYNPSAPNEDEHWVLPVPPPQPTLVYSPKYEGIYLSWDTKAETAIDPMLGTTDFRGYKVYRSMYAPSDWTMIAAFDNVDEEVAVTTTAGDTLATNVNLPPIQNTFLDNGGEFLGESYDKPVNGLPYYYAVVAYDPAKEAVGDRPALNSIESPRTNFKVDPETGAPQPVIPQGLYETSDGQVTESWDIDDVTVVPNPYLGTSVLEERYTEKIMFQNLPPSCKISIYTLTGDHVISIDHTSGTSQELWNIRSRNEQDVKTGAYFYVVEDMEGNKKTGKMVILR